MSFFEFPHTRTYDSDLGWLIKEFSQIADQYEELKEFVERYPSDYAGLERRITALEGNIGSFEANVVAMFDRLSSQLSSEIYRQLQAALGEINRSLADVYLRLSDIDSAIVRQRLDLEGRIEASEDFNILYTDQKIEDLINSLPDLTTVNVYNPVRGEVTNIQTAVNDLYDLGRSEALTALAYDTLGLTAQEYDDLELTAIEYDQFGSYYLSLNGYVINPYHYMTSPFTGELVRLEVVINELASLHKDDTLTASEYDALDLDASYYDALDLTAFDYDWHSKTLVV